MERKLYRVKVVLYVMAEDESAARMAATRAKFDIFECTARKADHIERGWEDAIPYNSDEAHTCAEILSNSLGSAHSAIRLPVESVRQKHGRRASAPAYAHA